MPGPETPIHDVPPVYFVQFFQSQFLLFHFRNSIFIDFEPLLKAIDVEGISLLQKAIQYDQTARRLLLLLAGTSYDRGHRFLVADSMLQANAVYNPPYNAFLMMGGILLPRFCAPPPGKPFGKR